MDLTKLRNMKRKRNYIQLKAGEMFNAYDRVNGKLARGAPFKAVNCNYTRTCGWDSDGCVMLRVFVHNYELNGIKQGWRIERCK